MRDGRSLRTKTIWNNKDPVFNQVLSFVVDEPEHQSVTAMVKDDDMHAFSKVGPNCACTQSAVNHHMHQWIVTLCHGKGEGNACSAQVGPPMHPPTHPPSE